jgi:hypothetical protein
MQRARDGRGCNRFDKSGEPAAPNPQWVCTQPNRAVGLSGLAAIAGYGREEPTISNGIQQTSSFLIATGLT